MLSRGQKNFEVRARKSQDAVKGMLVVTWILKVILVKIQKERRATEKASLSWRIHKSSQTERQEKYEH